MALPEGDGESTELSLPKQFAKIQDILNGEIRVNSMVNVIGIIRDYRPPMRSRGSGKFTPADRRATSNLTTNTRCQDFKSTMSFFDKSTEPEGGSPLTINIFRPNDDAPEISAGDVVVIYQAKVQYWGGPSLISNWATAIYIYSAARIPKPPETAALAVSQPLGGKSAGKKPTDKEHEYVSWLYHNVDSCFIPEPAQFKMQVERSMTAKDKFKLLKDVRDFDFCNAIVQVVLKPYVAGDLATMWVTDYTTNEGFKNFSYQHKVQDGPSDGDPFGYIKSAQKDWPGPFGQRAIQLTAWGMHAAAIEANATQGSWLMLRNVQIKFGRDASYLEGFIREDRGARDPILQVEALKIGDDIDGRFKDALKRKLAYEKLKKKQLQDQGLGASSHLSNTQKNKTASLPEIETRKMKRQRLNAKRQQQEQEAASKASIEKQPQESVAQKQVGAGPRLNQSIKCESIDRPATRLATILDPVSRVVDIDKNGESTAVALPFVNSKHRIIVRVVDFAPRKLQDFSRWRQKTEYDILSEHSGTDTDSEDDTGRDTLESYRGEKIWEWRFALQLEEFSLDEESEEPRKVWVLVDNIEGQQLTNLNACDLRAEEDQMGQLREQLFRLWGNLEEIKTAEAQSSVARKDRINAHKPPESSPPRADLSEAATTIAKTKLSNTPFTCCIRQYGARVPEDDQSKADAGPDRRWQRLFGLFGTRIASGVPE
ncbi:hypothetical protein Micbo1qcDRAFT_232697 [Microdochium bolleyi]|uniref:Protection of telomeres protein 1 ssDNA-binding domain-containing protein n=1 Tax=Microdochium bolleyi TaxID=196109 RepID=A0A136J7N9_9PEZI|nr:hypothetical protein Micbo1qcDRAFT_232697 [Microdochium bolleyi]